MATLEFNLFQDDIPQSFNTLVYYVAVLLLVSLNTI